MSLYVAAEKPRRRFSRKKVGKFSDEVAAEAFLPLHHRTLLVLLLLHLLPSKHRHRHRRLVLRRAVLEIVGSATKNISVLAKISPHIKPEVQWPLWGLTSRRIPFGPLDLVFCALRPLKPYSVTHDLHSPGKRKSFCFREIQLNIFEKYSKRRSDSDFSGGIVDYCRGKVKKTGEQN